MKVLLATFAVAFAARGAHAEEAVDELVEVDLRDVQAGAEVHDGRIWQDTSYGTGEAFFTAVAVAPDDSRRVYAASNGALFVSADAGVTWTRVLRVRGSASGAELAAEGVDEEALVEDEVEDRIESARDDLLEEIRQQITDDLVAELGSYGEELAEEIAGELAEQQLADEEDELAEEARAEFRRNEKFGPTNTEEQTGPVAPRLEPRRIHRILALPGGRVLVASGSGLFESLDYGGSFEEFAVGLLPAERDVRAVAADPRRPNVLLAGTLAGLYVSEDGGTSWQEVQGFPEKLAFFDLAVSPADPTRLLAATNDGVYRSADGGQSFEPVSRPTSFESRMTEAVVFDETDPRIAYAGTRDGLYRSLDGGAEWTLVEAEGLQSRETSDLAVAPWGLVATTTAGVFLSIDHGESFRELYAGLDAEALVRAATGANALEVYVATDGGLFGYRTALERLARSQTVTDLRRLFASEPTIEAVSARALAFMQVEMPVERWRAQAAIAPWVPRLTVRYDAIDPIYGPFDLRVGNQTIPPTFYNFRQMRDGVTAQFTWSLRRAMWQPENLSISRAHQRLEKERARVLRRVVNTYNARRRMQVALIERPPADVLAFAQKTLQIDELSAVLDGLTDGWFTSALAHDGGRPLTRTR